MAKRRRGKKRKKTINEMGERHSFYFNTDETFQTPPLIFWLHGSMPRRAKWLKFIAKLRSGFWK
jgi:hypothetical protein